MKIFYTPEAKEDLLNIKASVIEKFDSTELADEVLRDITKNIRSLETFPYMGKELFRILSVSLGYRYLFCRHNYIFYRVERDTIKIVRVLNEKQDYMRIMFGVTDE